MKRFVFSVAVLAGLLFFQSAHAQEAIINFDGQLEIQKNASIRVTETITYDFGGAEKHGIYRDIPLHYTSALGNYNLRISNITVSDETGNQYQVSISNESGKKHIRVGDPDQLITGSHTYIIQYTIDRAILYHDSFDSLAWNVTGNDWAAPIMNLTGRVMFPPESNLAGSVAQCYQGQLGSTEQCTGAVESLMLRGTNAFGFSNTSLRVGEGVTIDIHFPKGIVTQPSQFQMALDFVKDNWVVGIPVLVFIIMFYLWYTRGRDPKGRGTIIPQYDPPEGLTPSEVGTIIDESASNKDVSADIINLAIHGYIKIEQIEEKKFLKTDIDYRFTKLKLADEALAPFEQKLLNGLFSTPKTVMLDSTRDITASVGSEQKGLHSVQLSDLKDKFYQTLLIIKSDIGKSVTKKGYFAASPQLIRTGFVVVAVMILILSQFAFRFGAVFGVSVIASALCILFFGWLMPQRTYQGALMREYILGLKDYLQVAEADRIKFHNAPEKKPERFEKLLPYAMVLGVEKQWAGQFKDIYTQPPNWYHSNYSGGFNSLLLVHNLSALNAKTSSTLSSSPSSHGGAGGGGFSGGGFGGGGGGSW